MADASVAEIPTPEDVRRRDLAVLLGPAREVFIDKVHGDPRPLPTGDIPQRLGVSSASAGGMVIRLSAKGLIGHDRHRGQRLTREGRKIALELVRHHRLLEMFLVQMLGCSWDEEHDEAERREHVISERMERRIHEPLGHPELDPYGHAIPSLNRKGRPLTESRSGETMVLQGVSDDDPGRLRETERRGLLPGTRTEIVEESKFEGPNRDQHQRPAIVRPARPGARDIRRRGS